ncbi:MAG: hypothetical protein Q8R31_02045, partial [Candidatus Omnitrophota bacterium]|nr:hypothetical protein [Candidatus Omnitrophota bacterium]
ELAPSEIRVFKIEVEDIWFVQDKTISTVKQLTDNILNRVANTEYYPRAKEIADTIYTRLDGIVESQSDEAISREKHIGIYRENLITLEQIKEDIARLEKILATAGGPLAPEMLSKTKIKSESPSKTMTWVVIFAMIIFVGLLAGILFFTWQHQARLTREELLAAKKSSFPEAEKEEDSSSQKQEPQEGAQ